MNQDELQERILMFNHLEQQESKPAAPYDPSEGMNEPELRDFVRFLYGQITDKDKANQEILSELRGLRQDYKESDRRHTEERRELLSKIDSLTQELEKMNLENRALKEENGVLKSELYNSSKSRKGIEKNQRTKGKNHEHENHDNENPSSESLSTNSAGSVKQVQDESTSVYHGPSRKGATYNKSVVGEPVIHKCALDKLPAGTIVLKVMKPKVIRTVVNYIEEHHFERVKVKYPDGRIRTVYLPEDNDATSHLYDEVVPGTHITASLLAFLLFNRYQMASPDYRESKNRLSEMNWDTCRQNLANWADKGAIALNKLIPALKNVALQDGANVNVDETWCRYQTHFGHRKTYMWTLVNRKAGIVIFFYENSEDEDGAKHEGGRRRAVLKEFLGDAKIKSLQSDGYSVYMYLDDELMDIEHLCCMAHLRNQLKDAYNQGCEEARFFLEKIGLLYSREDKYRDDNLSPIQIKEMRNDSYTDKIVDAIESEMYDLLALPEKDTSPLLRKALNYLRKYWKQLFAYRNDGEYTIDNMAAERAIRPMTVQRKNSLFFGSTQGALRSAIYNTFIETCKQAKISFQQFFCKYLAELKKGRTDYENLLPMTICLKS